MSTTTPATATAEGPPLAANTRAGRPNMTRAIVAGAVTSSTLVFALTGALVWSVDGSVVNGIGIGLFCAFWGGLGFGVMGGGIAHAFALERD